MIFLIFLIENILTGCITAWYGNCSAYNHKALQRVVRTAQYTTGVSVEGPNIFKDSSHPSHRLFSLLLHGKRYRSVKSMSKRLLNSFFPQAIRLLNS